jgi:hypothetical protein
LPFEVDKVICDLDGATVKLADTSPAGAKAYRISYKVAKVGRIIGELTFRVRPEGKEQFVVRVSMQGYGLER